MAKILVVDSELNAGRSVAVALRTSGHDATVVTNGAQALAVIRGRSFDLVLCDLGLPDMRGLDLLRSIKRESPHTAVLVSNKVGSVEDAVEAMQIGALDYLEKPIGSTAILAAVQRGLERAAPSSVGGESEADLSAVTGIIGRSPSVRDLLEMIAKVADTESSVLITGETGTGKELIGKSIHKLSRRRSKVFCAVNSAAFPESLLESELFGHRRGAFTGATSNKKGLFEFAHEGTVFMDEVAEMPISMQVKLLRFLQTGEIRPVGDEATRYVDVRLVAATNKNLEEEVAVGTFREDLFYRLAVIPIHVAPLRERREDIPLLVSHFLRQFAARAGKQLDCVDDAAMDLLVSYAWPGNVRQLENSIERGVALCRGSRITTDDLPRRLREARAPQSMEGVHSLQAIERNHILETLDKVGWNRKRAAQLLQISTTTLWRRLKEFGVETDGGRRPVMPVASHRDSRIASR